jgi:hypothetical protein
MCGMSDSVSRILVVVAFAATLLLAGCSFGEDNVGDIYGTNEPARNSSEHKIPESQKSGTVSGDPAPDTAR